MRSLLSLSADLSASANVISFFSLSDALSPSITSCCALTDASRLLMFSSISAAFISAATALFSKAAAFCTSSSCCFLISSISLSLFKGFSSFVCSSFSLRSSAFASTSTAFGFAALVTGETSMIVIASRMRYSSPFFVSKWQEST